jgi:hypothetical protein
MTTAACSVITAAALASAQANPAEQTAASIEEQFRTPPESAKPRVWWHWMNGNISKDGIAKDFAWMKRIGIGGVQNFDANLETPQIVPKRLVYMEPDWKDAFRFAVREADRHGLEFTIASSPGWSATGGPWVKPQDAMKKLVWSEIVLQGGRRFTGSLPALPTTTGPYQGLPKAGGIEALLGGKGKPAPQAGGDARVLAWPVEGPRALPTPRLIGPTGAAMDPAPLLDEDIGTVVTLEGDPDGRAQMEFVYDRPQTFRSARLFLPGAYMMWLGGFATMRIEASSDGKSWQRLAEMETTPVPTTVGFAPVTASRVRVVFHRRVATLGSVSADPAEGVDKSGVRNLTQIMQRPLKLNVAQFKLSPGAQVDQAEAKAGYYIAPDYYKLDSGAADDPGVPPGRVLDLSDRLKADGTLDWTPPRGKWRVVRFGWSLTGTTNHPATAEATGLEVDKFDGAAVRRYLDHYLGMYRDAAGTDMVGARGIRAILTDSIEVGASNWTPRLLEEFRRRRGYDAVPWLPTITGTIIGSRTQSDQFLYDFRRTLGDLLASEHYGTIANVAHENGLMVYGEALEDSRPSLGDDMALRSHADIPMAALWTHNRKEGPRLTLLADMKGASSVAHIYGRKIVAAESMTSASAFWDHGPAYLKRIIDLEFANGINRPVIHTSVHQPRDDKVPGLSLSQFGQFFNRHEAWAELAKPWVDYMSRNAFMLQQGVNVADVAYFYGEEAPLTGLYGQKPVSDAPRFHAYDFVNADALTNALSNKGNSIVTPGGARYQVLYLGGSSRLMTLPSLRTIASLAEGGATIVGKKPEGSPGLGDSATEYEALTAKLWASGGETRVGRGRVIASNDVEAALRSMGVSPQVEAIDGETAIDVPFVHRRLADGDSFFIVNPRDGPLEVLVRFRVTGKAPEIWRAETGAVEAVGYRMENGVTVVPLSLARDESVHVVFRKQAVVPAVAVEQVEPVEVGRINGPWRVAFQQGRGAPPSAVLPKLSSLSENADDGIKHFSGIATYTKDFVTPNRWRAGQPLWLDLGAAREIAEVSVNGRTAGYSWHAPYRVNIGPFTKIGRNRLRIRVANLWVNRLIGDAQPGARKVTWTAFHSTYLPTAPLRPSGLIGPVRLLSDRVQQPR